VFTEAGTARGQYIGEDEATAIRVKQADPVSALLTLPESPTPDALELALRAFSDLAGPDPLRRATLRGAAIEALRARKVSGAAAVVDAALGAGADAAESGSGGALDLPEPEPWPVAVDGAELLANLAAVIRRHVILTVEQADAVALWAIFSHAIDGARISPKLAITSPTPRCGKSTLLALIAALVPRPLVASNISPAAVFRVIEKANPTLLIDEADSFLKDNEELRGVLNSGHSRDGAYVIRCVGDNLEPTRFCTWCAQAVGLIGSLPATLADRSIEVRLQRKRAAESVAKLTRLGREGLAILARQVARWAADNPIGDASAAIPAGLNDRASDNWEPLLAIAAAAGGEWPERSRNAAVKLSGGEPADAQAIGVQLLADIRAVFFPKDGDGKPLPQLERIGSKDLAEALAGMEASPWPEWRHGKPMTAPQLARQLGHFGVAPRNLKQPSGAVLKGYARDGFEEAWARYAPVSSDSPLSNRYPATDRINTGQNHDFETATERLGSGLENAVSPNKDGHGSGVAVSNPPSWEKEENGPPQRDLWEGEA